MLRMERPYQVHFNFTIYDRIDPQEPFIFMYKPPTFLSPNTPQLPPSDIIWHLPSCKNDPKENMY